MALGIALEFYTSVTKGLKIKVRKILGANSYTCRSCSGKTGSKGLFVPPLYWIGLKLMAKNKKRKIKSTFIIYSDFESILVPEDNWKQDLEESYTNKYQKHIAWSYGCKLVCVDDKFNKTFKTYLGEDAAYNFINSMIKESKYCSEVIKIHFNKELVMTKENNADCKNWTILNVRSVTMIILIMMLK